MTPFLRRSLPLAALLSLAPLAPAGDPTPSLTWSTFFGGSSQFDRVIDIETDATGVYVLGSDFPGLTLPPGGFQETPSNASEGLVLKLAPDGSEILWATYLGGSGSELFLDLELTPDGAVCVAGQTWSGDYPVTQDAFQSTPSGLYDGFLTVLDPSGSSLLYSTRFGGSDKDSCKRLVHDDANGLWVTGGTTSDDLPVTPGAYRSDPAATYLMHLDLASGAPSWVTYFEGAPTGLGGAADMVADSQGRLVVAARAMEVETTPGVLLETGPEPGTFQTFLARFDPAAQAVDWMTWFGTPTESVSIWSLGVDAAGAIYVGGQIDGTDLPTTPGAFQETSPGTINGFVAKVLPEATGYAWCTYLGATGFAPGTGSAEYVRSLEVAPDGRVVVAGTTGPPPGMDFPTTPDAVQPTFGGTWPGDGDYFLTMLDATGEELVYSSYLGGSSDEFVGILALDPQGGAIVGGDSYSADYPLVAPLQAALNGLADATLTRTQLPGSPWEVLGDGLVGAMEKPTLVGVGTLEAGAETRLSARGVAPLAPGALVVGTSLLQLPVAGGVLVPSPTVLLPLNADADGASELVQAWPGVPAGMSVLFQAWFVDAGGVAGFSATNALRGVAQ